MIFFCFGIDHKITSLPLREKAYAAKSDIEAFWRRRSDQAVFLHTCNRIEVYGLISTHQSLRESIALSRRQFPGLFEKAYCRQGKYAVIKHALALACGLQSQIFAESQVFEQLKTWHSRIPFSSALDVLWQNVLDEVTEVRLLLGLDQTFPTLCEIVLSDIASQSVSGRSKQVYVIGTGSIAQSFARHHRGNGIVHFVSRKKNKRARQLARQTGGEAFLLDEKEEVLLRADAVVSATASPHSILQKRELSRIDKKRKTPLHIYDLGFPRDVEPGVRGLRNVIVRNLDDLNALFAFPGQRMQIVETITEARISRCARDIQEKINEVLCQSRNTTEPACI